MAILWKSQEIKCRDTALMSAEESTTSSNTSIKCGEPHEQYWREGGKSQDPAARKFCCLAYFRDAVVRFLSSDPGAQRERENFARMGCSDEVERGRPSCPWMEIDYGNARKSSWCVRIEFLWWDIIRSKEQSRYEETVKIIQVAVERLAGN